MDLLVRNTFHNKSHNNASTLASSPSTEHVVLESAGAQNTVKRFENSLLSGLFLITFSSSDPAVSSPNFVGEKRERLMQKVQDPRCGGEFEVRVYECLQGLESVFMVLAGSGTDRGRLSRDVARANLRSRRAPGLGRNHLSCKREYPVRGPSHSGPRPYTRL